MYVAVKGGEKAIDAAHALMAEERRGDPAIPEVGCDQLASQLRLAVDRIMAEGALYDRELAALALKQAQGDNTEAVFLLRAYRTTLSRFGVTAPIDTAAMTIRRRISAVFKDMPGGQVLGPTFDYSHRLLDFSLLGPTTHPHQKPMPAPARPIAPMNVRIADLLANEDLIEPEVGAENTNIGDLTRDPMGIPASRDIRLQNLARADEGFLLSMAYSYQRGFGADAHPFVGEIRIGEVVLEVTLEALGFPIEIGAIAVTECVMLHACIGNRSIEPTYTKGYGLTFGACERKAMSMSIVDRAMRATEFGEKALYPVQDQEFILYHSDSVEASGFVQHLKLPHYVDFQSDLLLMRRIKAEFKARRPDESQNADPTNGNRS
jgi:alpha-D-ribose 1-methylphosphonate 5-triphosphate synthase subunit PhnI